MQYMQWQMVVVLPLLLDLVDSPAIHTFNWQLSCSRITVPEAPVRDGFSEGQVN